MILHILIGQFFDAVQIKIFSNFLKTIFGPKMTILGPRMEFLGPYNSLQPNTIKYKGRLDYSKFTGSIFLCYSDENIFKFSKNHFRSQNDHFRTQNGVLGQ